MASLFGVWSSGVVQSPGYNQVLVCCAALSIEDDYDVEYRFGREPVASLQGLAPDGVVFVGTTSKTLATRSTSRHPADDVVGWERH